MCPYMYMYTYMDNHAMGNMPKSPTQIALRNTTGWWFGGLVVGMMTFSIYEEIKNELIIVLNSV